MKSEVINYFKQMQQAIYTKEMKEVKILAKDEIIQELRANNTVLVVKVDQLTSGNTVLAIKV